MLSSFHEGKRLGQAIGQASKITVARKKSGTNNDGSAAETWQQKHDQAACFA